MKPTHLIALGSAMVAAMPVIFEGIRPDGTPGQVTVLLVQAEALPADFTHSHPERAYGESFHEMDIIIQYGVSPPSWIHLASRPL